ncbi:MAG: helix-turn-helix transcriptional regulator [Candidatus Omnitrophica bacterium]|nr:helix-turn-helix transcriptional regulator [Candidatus Omnitrophota bacterium]
MIELIKNTKQLGQVIRKRRKELKLTQKEVSDLCNTGNRFISELENGKPTVQLEKVLKIINALGLEVQIVHKGFETWKS